MFHRTDSQSDSSLQPFVTPSARRFPTLTEFLKWPLSSCSGKSCNMSVVSPTLKSKTSAHHAASCLCSELPGKDSRNCFQRSETEDCFSANLNCRSQNVRNPVFRRTQECIHTSCWHTNVCLCPSILLHIRKIPQNTSDVARTRPSRISPEVAQFPSLLLVGT